MPTLTKGWLETQAAFEARKVAEEKKEQESFEAALKDGTIGRVVNDREDQARVVKWRQEQAKLQKGREEQAKILNDRRRAAKEFHYHQEIESSKTQPAFESKKLPAVAKRLSMWKPKRHQPVDVATQTLELTRPLRNV